MQTPVPDTDSLPAADPQAESLRFQAFHDKSNAPNGAPVSPAPLVASDPTLDAPLPPPHMVFQESSLSPEPERRKIKRSSSASPPPASPAPASPPPPPPANDRVTLTVRDKENNEFTFQVKRTTPFRKVFEAFSSKMKEPPSTFRFLYDGKRISPSDTVISLDISNGDSIDAMVEAQGGQC
ncbi:Ubiquitin-2 like Rad60 SUMO-like protein [Gracilaria domingensis]|nr:Ubiquitin-2 like Rad60 SUMO-like protein [Gracilaria domingensis]